MCERNDATSRENVSNEFHYVYVLRRFSLFISPRLHTVVVESCRLSVAETKFVVEAMSWKKKWRRLPRMHKCTRSCIVAKLLQTTVCDEDTAYEVTSTIYLYWAHPWSRRILLQLFYYSVLTRWRHTEFERVLKFIYEVLCLMKSAFAENWSKFAIIAANHKR